MKTLFALALCVIMASISVPQCLGTVVPCTDTGSATGTAAGRA